MTQSAVSAAARAARRFRVEQSDQGVLLVDQQDAERTVELRQSRIHLTIEARLHRVCRSLVPGGLERWLAVEVVQLALGSEGDSSAVSVWPDDDHDRYDAENAIFGIDAGNLEHLEITHARIVDLEARDEYGHWYVERPTDSPLSTDETDRIETDNEDNEDPGAVADLWYHTGEDRFSGYGWSALVLTVGFPEPQFGELFDACVSGRADTLVLECSGYAKTTGWAFQSARDLIVSAGESVRLQINEATMSAPLREGALQASEKVESASHAADGMEWDPERNVSTPRAPVRAGPALVTATITLSLLSALFGAGAVPVLTIAILGATAAIIATLSSFTAGVMERLSLLGEIMLQRGRR
jgi:hypothetical protein